MEDRNSYQTSQVADQLGVSVSTVRRLCSRYAAHLSEEATPRPGGRRLFNAVDVAILGEASRLTNAGMGEEEIDQRLAQSVTLPAETITPPTTAPPQLPTLSFDTSALEDALRRQAAAQDAQTAALVRLASAHEEGNKERQLQADIELAHVEALQLHARAMDRLADRLVWVVGALVVIFLLTVAVASGWI